MSVYVWICLFMSGYVCLCLKRFLELAAPFWQAAAQKKSPARHGNVFILIIDIIQLMYGGRGVIRSEYNTRKGRGAC